MKKTTKKPTLIKKRASTRKTSGTDSTWSPNAASGVWNTPGNWSSGNLPTGTATFGASDQTDITFASGSSAAIDSLAFASGADAYNLSFTDSSPSTPTLTISGSGVSNASSNAQFLNVAAFAESRDTPQLAFKNGANAGGSNMQYKAGPTDAAGQGGGVIRFYDTSSAGSAAYEVTTGSGTPPRFNSTVGGEVTFSEKATAGTASFKIYGSTSLTDGDTFGNVVFHDSATAAQGTFLNIGGTVSGGDGGNTQFYDTSNAGNAVFTNLGATAAKGNGGDCAFDSVATAAQGTFHNYPSTANGGYGGVTSFNNNCPQMPASQGASAGKATVHNYGASAAGQGGGHTYFTAKYGSPTAASGNFFNHGAAVSGTSSNAGRTVFSISYPQLDAFTPTAGNGNFTNLAGSVAGAPGGLTEFTVYTDGKTSPCGGSKAPAKGAKPGKTTVNSVGPNAGTASIMNVGAMVQGASGGQTTFGGATAQGIVTSAANASISATGGSNGGYGGRIIFYAGSVGGSATISLAGNGTLDVSGLGASLTIGALSLAGGVIVCSLGTKTTGVNAGKLSVSDPVTFAFSAGTGFATGQAYTILTSAGLSSSDLSKFSGNAVNGAAPSFSISGNSLQVTFISGDATKARLPKSRTKTR